MNKEYISKLISFMRLPMIVGIVMIHAKLANITFKGVNVLDQGNYDVFLYVSTFISHIVCNLFVPLYFIISGYLYFANVKEYSKETYAYKTRRRFRSLVVPYIIWNLYSLILFALLGFIASGFLSGSHKPITDYSLLDFLYAFWNTSLINPSDLPMPINGPLWFIRNLIVVQIVFAPAIYYVVKKLKIIPVLILGLLWLFEFDTHIVGFSVGDLFFFTLGAYTSLYMNTYHRLNRLTPPLQTITVCTYLATCIKLMYSREEILLNVNILLGIVVAIIVGSFAMDKGCKIPRTLAESSFFVYAYHGLVILGLSKVLWKVFRPEDSAGALIIYFLSPIITISLGVLLYVLLKKLLPRFTKVIVGGR